MHLVLTKLRKNKKKKFAYHVHVKKDFHRLSITDVNTFDTHVDSKHRAFVLISSLVEVAMTLLQIKQI